MQASYYVPSNQGYEETIGRRMDWWTKKRNAGQVQKKAPGHVSTATAGKC